MAPHKDIVQSNDRVLRNRVVTKSVFYIGRKTSPPHSGSQKPQFKSGPKPKPRKVNAKVRKCTLTQKRKKKIFNFLKKMHLKPLKEIGTFGSTMWMKCLIKYLREPKRTAPTVDDVRRWMETDFFEKTMRKILATLPPELPSVEPPTFSEMESEMDSFVLTGNLRKGSETPTTYVESESEVEEAEPVRGKTGWRATSEKFDCDCSDSDASVEIEAGCSNSSWNQDKRASANAISMATDPIVENKTKKPSIYSNTDCHKGVIKIFPEGFKWMTTFGPKVIQRAKIQDVPSLEQKQPVELNLGQEQHLKEQYSNMPERPDSGLELIKLEDVRYEQRMEEPEPSLLR